MSFFACRFNIKKENEMKNKKNNLKRPKLKKSKFFIRKNLIQI